MHVAHGYEHVAFAVHDGNVGGRILGGEHGQMPRPDARGGAGAAQHVAVCITAHSAAQLHRQAQTAQVVADVAAHAARRKMQAAGVGIPHYDGSVALAVDVHVRAADPGNVSRHGRSLLSEKAAPRKRRHAAGKYIALLYFFKIKNASPAKTHGAAEM